MYILNLHKYLMTGRARYKFLRQAVKRDFHIPRALEGHQRLIAGAGNPAASEGKGDIEHDRDLRYRIVYQFRAMPVCPPLSTIRVPKSGMVGSTIIPLPARFNQ
jgi:hypothetical protein